MLPHASCWAQKHSRPMGRSCDLLGCGRPRCCPWKRRGAKVWTGHRSCESLPTVWSRSAWPLRILILIWSECRPCLVRNIGLHGVKVWSPSHPLGRLSSSGSFEAFGRKGRCQAPPKSWNIYPNRREEHRFVIALYFDVCDLRPKLMVGCTIKAINH